LVKARGLGAAREAGRAPPTNFFLGEPSPPPYCRQSKFVFLAICQFLVYKKNELGVFVSCQLIPVRLKAGRHENPWKTTGIAWT